MKRNITIVSSLSLLLLLGFSLSPSRAETTVIEDTARGWYDGSGNHTATNLNYAVGAGGRGAQPDVRNFFVFDLSGITRPIVSADLGLYLPGPSRLGYLSADASENYELHDVVTTIATLVADSSGASGIPIHDDLGSGTVYGSRAVTAADMGSLVEIPLNSSAIAAMNASHGLFAIGGSLTTLDFSVATTVFASTNSTDVTELRLTLVPEPAGCALAIIAVSVLGTRHRRRRYLF